MYVSGEQDKPKILNSIDQTGTHTVDHGGGCPNAFVMSFKALIVFRIPLFLLFIF